MNQIIYQLRYEPFRVGFLRNILYHNFLGFFNSKINCVAKGKLKLNFISYYSLRQQDLHFRLFHPCRYFTNK